MVGNRDVYSIGVCAYCGKRVYQSRTLARKGAKSIHPGAHNLSAYECRKALSAGITGLWHFGHLQPGMVHGDQEKFK